MNLKNKGNRTKTVFEFRDRQSKLYYLASFCFRGKIFLALLQNAIKVFFSAFVFLPLSFVISYTEDSYNFKFFR